MLVAKILNKAVPRLMYNVIWALVVVDATRSAFVKLSLTPIVVSTLSDKVYIAITIAKI